ncbi:MAG: hypothetical protein AAFU53_11455, partial [Cyanobacteria bacterium J06632_3]
MMIRIHTLGCCVCCLYPYNQRDHAKAASRFNARQGIIQWRLLGLRVRIEATNAASQGVDANHQEL